ncbi:MAG TPA: alpha-ketoacid dehydrogenase subunit beta [Planctomycetes bacterium]|nr:alpha-ketoacid dehydrogenase subunit beta [Planctomycetota bacterium]
MTPTPLSFREAVREAMAEAMRADPSVFLMGEDIGVYGGAFGVSKGLLDEFGPDRVLQTPISENSFVGAAVGAAAGGLRPIVEIMFADFLTCCTDALVNHAAKFRYMYDGKLTVPMVLRTPMGRRFGYGATHSQSPEAFFLHVPGLKVVAPHSPNDAKALLLASIHDPDPVLFFEHKLLYDTVEERSSGDETVRLGEARVVRPGRDVTLISYARGVTLSLEAASALVEQGIQCEVIDLRTLAPMDVATCIASVRRTGRAVVVSEDCLTGGVASAVAVELGERAFEYLLGPIARVSAVDVPVPSGPVLEDAVMVSSEEIARQAQHLVRSY